MTKQWCQQWPKLLQFKDNQVSNSQTRVSTWLFSKMERLNPIEGKNVLNKSCVQVESWRHGRTDQEVMITEGFVQ